MPDVARQRVSLSARRPTAADSGEPEPRIVRSVQYLGSASAPRRSRGATTRFMNRLDLSLRAASAWWLAGLLGALAALAVAVSIPNSLLIETGLIACVTLATGLVAYVMFALRPLEDLNRCIGDLGTANVRFRRQNMLLDAALANVHRQKEQLDVALNNMSQGLAMFDAEQRLVVCNKLYAEMYGLSADLVEPGMPLQRIADQLVAVGCYSDDQRRRVC